ncbi:hypothetical protein J2S74_002910 [Evansella vedderi]|uniref:Uncharacterized protein n=2 Tax=Evansella vedderi TaxID=38282 RepID=A0ABT9ZWB4_9BACI|nr:hypothetical protein [Evansella vedderi]
MDIITLIIFLSRSPTRVRELLMLNALILVTDSIHLEHSLHFLYDGIIGD